MMNKTQFAKAVAAESGETAASTVRVMDAMMKVIGVCMAHDERIVLPGFGSFYTQERPAYDAQSADGEATESCRPKDCEVPRGC